MPSEAFQMQAARWLAENGTPKLELLFQALVYHPCAFIPAALLGTELYGYERGAFTGHLAQKTARFEMADRGTLFLDEVVDIRLGLQLKLLRALQEKGFERLGGTKTIAIAVRLVAATNRNLKQMMADERFRSDLYHKLRVFPITTPLLRDHPIDIPLLGRLFTKKYAPKMKKHIERIASDIMRTSVSWTWPGNAGELKHFTARTVVLSRGSHLSAAMGELRTNPANSPGPRRDPGPGLVKD